MAFYLGSYPKTYITQQDFISSAKHYGVYWVIIGLIFSTATFWGTAYCLMSRYGGFPDAISHKMIP